MIAASAPVRICDLGGWTDTWFGGPGRVVNVAVAPGVEVSIRATETPEPVVLDVEAFGHRYPVVPGASRVARHPLLEAAIDELPPPDDVHVEISVRAAVPAGCGAGTSAAVAVALLGALAAARAEQLSPAEIARAAHRLEVDVLGTESGVQDQLSAAYGGINSIEIASYPEAAVESLPAWPELGPRLSLVFLGRPHNSSALHHLVIESIEGAGSKAFERLRAAASAARDAVLAQDLVEFGRAMVANTDAQQALHPELVGTDARRLIETAAAHGAFGWKVNGAGGPGGSLTFLSATPEAKHRLDQRVGERDAACRVLPVTISPTGLQVQRGWSRGERGGSGA